MDRKPSIVRQAYRRSGFTLIEIMVVVGIILILVAVSVVGIAQVVKHTKAQRTQTALESARSLLAGYTASDKTLTQLKLLYATSIACQIEPAMGPTFDPGHAGALVAAKGPNGEHRWSKIKATSTQLALAVDYTSQVMQVLLRVPENRDIMSKLPAEAKFQVTDDNDKPLVIIVGGANAGTVPPLLADGNGEPILFVPPAGMSNVTVSGASPGGAGLIQSDGRWHPYPPIVDPVANVTRTPFFASAGSDRDFTAGDDNAYSVHQ